MKISATLVAAASLCIGLTAASVGVADDELPAVSAPQGGVVPATTAVGTGTQPNCLLPGRLRDFHGIAMLAPRQAVTLDTADCTARGGTPIDSAAVAN